MTLPPGVRYRTPEPDSISRTLPDTVDTALGSTDSDTGSQAAEYPSPDQAPVWSTSSMPSSPTSRYTRAHQDTTLSGAIPLDAQFEGTLSNTTGETSARNLVVPYSPGFTSMLQQQHIANLPYEVPPINSTSSVGSGFVGSSWDAFGYFQGPPQTTLPQQTSGFEVSRTASSRVRHSSASPTIAWEGSQSQPAYAIGVTNNPDYPAQARPESYYPHSATANNSSDGHANQTSFHDDTELHRAVIKGDLNETKRLLDQKIDPNVGSITPLHYAAFQRNVELVKLLKRYGARLDVIADNNRSILYFAVCSQDRLERSGNMAYVKQGLRFSHSDEDTKEILKALYDSHSDVPHLLDSLPRADSSGVMPLMAAAEAGFHGTVKKLLKHSAEPHAKDHQNYTALKYAAGGGHDDLVLLLLEADRGVQRRDVDHMLKLARRNLSRHERTTADLRPRPRWWDSAINHDTDMIATQMVRVYRRLGMLDQVIERARRTGRTSVAEILEEKRDEQM